MKKLLPIALLLVLATAVLCFGQTGGMEYLSGLSSVWGKSVAFYFLGIGVAAFILFIVLAKPNIGIILALVLFPFVTQSAAMTIPKLLVSILLLGFFIAWINGKITVIKSNITGRNHLGCEKAFMMFLAYLAVNCAYGFLFNRISPLDAVRDLIPIISFVVFLVAKQSVKKEKGLALLEKISFVWIAFLTLNFVLAIVFYFNGVFHLVPAFASAMQIQWLFIISIVGLLYFKQSKAIFIISGLTSSIFLVTTDNRTQFIAAIFCMSLMFLITKMTKAKMAFLISGIVISGFIFIVSERFAPEAMASKVYRLNEIKDAQSDLSIVDRLGEARQCFEIFLKSPVLGMGAGFTYHLFRQSMGGGELASQINTTFMTNFTHSDLMFMLSKWGLIGVALFLWFYYKITRLAWLTWKNASTPESRAKGLACFLFFIDALIIGQSTPVIQTRSDAFFLAVIMGYAYSLYHIYVAKPRKERVSVDRATSVIGRSGYGESVVG